jgi:hypothetical protein
MHVAEVISMGWADRYVAALCEGQTVKFRPRGTSMSGLINDGQLVTVEPLTRDPIVDDIVLCRVKGAQYLHLIKAIQPDGRCLIGNNRGGTNGWTSRTNIYGIVVSIED